MLSAACQKINNLRRHPESTLNLAAPTTTNRTREIRARDVVTPEHDSAFADLVGAKYNGIDLRTVDWPGEDRVVVRFVRMYVDTIDEAVADSAAETSSEIEESR
ncbi:MAG: hypothetical protein U0031_08910 [Thermomicrobiales bacterium]